MKESLMSLIPKDDFERLLWERNKTKEQAKFILEQKNKISELQNQVKEFLSFWNNHQGDKKQKLQGHIFNLEKVITKNKFIISDLSEDLKKANIQCRKMKEKIIMLNKDISEYNALSEKDKILYHTKVLESHGLVVLNSNDIEIYN